MVLLVGAGGVLLLGWQIPELVERTGEIVGGVLLILMGAFTLWVVAAERLYGHTHRAGWLNWHVHFGRRDRHPAPPAHSSRAGLLGAVFAVSGLRALTLLGPELSPGGATASLLTLLYLVECLRDWHPVVDVAVRDRPVAHAGLAGDGGRRRPRRGTGDGGRLDRSGPVLGLGVTRSPEGRV